MLDGSVYLVSAYRSSCICYFRLGVHFVESKPICEHTNLAFAVKGAEYLGSSNNPRLAKSKAVASSKVNDKNWSCASLELLLVALIFRILVASKFTGLNSHYFCLHSSTNPSLWVHKWHMSGLNDTPRIADHPTNQKEQDANSGSFRSCQATQRILITRTHWPSVRRFLDNQMTLFDFRTGIDLTSENGSSNGLQG